MPQFESDADFAEGNTGTSLFADTTAVEVLMIRRQ
jgi:hypothetical protein